MKDEIPRFGIFEKGHTSTEYCVSCPEIYKRIRQLEAELDMYRGVSGFSWSELVNGNLQIKQKTKQPQIAYDRLYIIRILETEIGRLEQLKEKIINWTNK